MEIRDARQLIVAAQAVARDRRNRRAYGPHAPRVAELIWVDPCQIDRYIVVLPAGLTARNCSARVLDFHRSGMDVRPLLDARQVRSCTEHWRDGVPWEETEDYATILREIASRGKYAGCRNEEDLRNRFARLDEIYKAAAVSRTLKTQKELKRLNFREYGGIVISIDRAGSPILVKSSGYHRAAIGRMLRLKKIPAMLGLVDTCTIDHLPRLREP